MHIYNKTTVDLGSQAIKPIGSFTATPNRHSIRSMKNRIRELREREGLSQAQLADKVGTSQAQIDRLEKNQRRLSDYWMIKLSIAFQCPPEDIISEPMPPQEKTILEKFRMLEEHQKVAFSHMLDSIIGEKK